MLIRIAVLMLLCISVELYLLIRGLAGMREVALQAEEHRVLLPLHDGSIADPQLSLCRELEQVRWLQRLYHWQRLSLPMQFLLHGNFRLWLPSELHVSAKYSKVLVAQVHERLMHTIPCELATIAECADQQTALHRLARLLTLAFYARYWRNWEQGKQQLLTAVAGANRHKIEDLLRLLDQHEIAYRQSKVS